MWSLRAKGYSMKSRGNVSTTLTILSRGFNKSTKRKLETCKRFPEPHERAGWHDTPLCMPFLNKVKDYASWQSDFWNMEFIRNANVIISTRLDFIFHLREAESLILTPTVIGVCVEKDKGITHVVSCKDLKAQKWPRVDKQSSLLFLIQKYLGYDGRNKVFTN